MVEKLFEAAGKAVQDGTYRSMSVKKDENEVVSVKIVLDENQRIFLNSDGTVTLSFVANASIFPFKFEDMKQLAKVEMEKRREDKLAKLRQNKAHLEAKIALLESGEYYEEDIRPKTKRQEFVDRMKQYNKENKAARDAAREEALEEEKQGLIGRIFHK